jgi:hypothetical protein
MEVDHFNPTLSGRGRHEYRNLMLATPRCNGSKSNAWPTHSETKKHGRRFLNPCEELEYGEHIVEHPITHELIGLTPAGNYHIDFLDLNVSDLIETRQERWNDYLMLEKTRVKMAKNHSPESFPFEVLARLRESIAVNIPLFPLATAEQVCAYEKKMRRDKS